MLTDANTTALVVALLSFLTVAVAWIFRFKIANMTLRRNKAPVEILFEGYEKLLKNYQEAMADRDRKYAQMETDFDKLQQDLDHARATIANMKLEDYRKAQVIAGLELSLGELKVQHQKEGN